MKQKTALLNKTIVITRAEGQASEAKKQLISYGAKVLDLPALIIGPPKTWKSLDEAIQEINNFHWIIFSS